MKHRWNVKNHWFTLIHHINNHKKAHNEISHEYDFVQYKLPNENIQVGLFIKILTTNDNRIFA